ncbi:hypothetical protein [Actinomadura gamaensis]|uniref:Uncharacterized protein n=1 Tax=Actinomadura gamaensis TaxID=1763541 RepID=A0ABV9U5X3_9ACTN
MTDRFTALVATYRKTCNAFPAQYEGELRDGRIWYFRYRHGEAELGIGPDLDAAIDDSMNPDHSVRYGLESGGEIDSEAEFRALFVRLVERRPGLLTIGDQPGREDR